MARLPSSAVSGHFCYLVLIYTFLVVAVQCADYSCPFQRKGHCRFEGEGSTVACKLTYICHLKDLVQSTENVTSLDLSFSSITNIVRGSFSGLKNLRILSLAHNKIQVLRYEVFHGLDKLTSLNLTMNPLMWFSGNLSGLLPSLSTIDITGISQWKPDRELFQLPALKSITGWIYSKYCQNCLLYRSNVSLIFPEIRLTSIRECEYHYTEVINEHYMVQMLNNSYFNFTCKPNQEYCIKSLYHTRYYKVLNPCWRTLVVVINVQYSLGFLAVVFNFVVFVTILTSKNLWKNISMRFVCSMAFYDFLIGIYIIAITAYLNSRTYDEIYSQSHIHCGKIGFLWMLGQSGSVLSTFLLTLERYFVIVYRIKNPDLRIGPKMAVGLITGFGMFSLTLSVYALIFNFYKFNIFCIPIRKTTLNLHVFTFTIFIGSLALIFYLISFLCYVDIFISASRTGRSAGVNRESKLSKRIALLVFSNIFFFFAPVIIISGIAFGNESLHDTAHGHIVGIYFLKIFPMLCLSLNSCCNPVLHAFRYHEIQKVLKKRGRLLKELLMRPMIKRISPVCAEKENGNPSPCGISVGNGEQEASTVSVQTEQP